MILYSQSHSNLQNTDFDKNERDSVCFMPNGNTSGNARKTLSLGVAVISFLLVNSSSEEKSDSNTTFLFEQNKNIKEIKKIVLKEEKNEADFLKMNCCAQIQDLGLLEDNWDGYGAVKVLPECISNALNIINYKSMICDYIQDIYANPNGTVSILWDNEAGDSIGLEIGEKEFSYYVARKDGNEFVKNVNFSELHYKELSAYIYQL